MSSVKTCNVYEIIVIQDPTVDEHERGEESKVIAGPLQISAPNELVAILMAGASVTVAAPSRTRINVRPF